MEAFKKLPQEKREKIIDAAMSVFATHGYHKASVADIASAAGISKAMIFTYFGSKLRCYEFMCDEMLHILVEEFNKFKDQIFAVTGFFERIILTVKIKVDILKQCHSLLEFASSMYNERDEQVASVIKRIISEGYSLREMFLTTGVDSSKFKDASDAQTVGRMIDWLSYGCVEEWSNCKDEAMDGLLADFTHCILLLKKHFYKEEYI